MHARCCTRELGLDSETSKLLVGQTLEGAAAYLRSFPDFPAGTLREQVTSPGGTTAAALSVFSEQAFPQMVKDALVAANKRSQELAQ